MVSWRRSGGTRCSPLFCNVRRNRNSSHYSRAQGHQLAQSAHPSAIQRSNSETLSAGHAPSHGIVPAFRRAWIARACVRTSAADQRSKAKRIAPRSRARNKPLMWRSKLSASPGAGVSGGAGSAMATCPVGREEGRAAGVASHTHHQRGTGMPSGGCESSCEFSTAIRLPHSRYATNAARNSGSAASSASSALRHSSETHRARCASVRCFLRC
jgi:hypothetical protein